GAGDPARRRAGPPPASVGGHSGAAALAAARGPAARFRRRAPGPPGRPRAVRRRSLPRRARVPMMDELIERAAELLARRGPVVVFTGAGVSTESGIPDFRSTTGLWARYDPDDFSFQNFLGSEDGRRRYWALGRELYATIRAAAPNAAHRAIAELDRLGLLDCVIT